MESKDELDRVMDGALAGYSLAEPPAGFETRIVSRVLMASRQRRRVGWALAAAAAAAILVVGIAVRMPRHPVSKIVAAHMETPRPIEETRPAPPRPRMKWHKPRARFLPKLDQFPTPEPLTAEERALLALVERDANQARQVLAGLQKRGDTLIEIQPIQIAPLDSEGAQ